jgi:hypothetical protein
MPPLLPSNVLDVLVRAYAIVEVGGVGGIGPKRRRNFEQLFYKICDRQGVRLTEKAGGRSVAGQRSTSGFAHEVDAATRSASATTYWELKHLSSPLEKNELLIFNGNPSCFLPSPSYDPPGVFVGFIFGFRSREPTTSTTQEPNTLYNLAMNAGLKQRLDIFREGVSKLDASRNPLGLNPTDEQKLQAQQRQHKINELKAQFNPLFNEDERRQIEEYFFQELGPQVIEKEPAQLDPAHPERAREIPPEIWNEYLFLRHYFGNTHPG